MALNAATNLSVRPAVVAVAVLGLGLAMTRFDRQPGPWLAALLPPVVAPMAVEAARRRRGRRSRLIPFWTWGLASLVAIGLTLANQAFAPLAGLGIAIIATAVWAYRQ